MTVTVVLVEPPRSGPVLSEPTETSPFPEAEVADLCAAMLKDVCTAVERSGDDLLVNYRAEDELPDEFAEDHDSEAEIRSVVADALGGTDNARFESQVGSTFSARAGNIVSHLLNEEEEIHSVTVVRPITPLLGRTYLDSAAMKLRSTSVVLGLSTEGHVYSSGFPDPTGLTDAYVEPEAETLVRRADDAGHGLDYVPMFPVLETGADLATIVPTLRSRIEPERLVPEYTTMFAFEEGLRAESTDGVLEPVRD